MTLQSGAITAEISGALTPIGVRMQLTINLLHEVGFYSAQFNTETSFLTIALLRCSNSLAPSSAISCLRSIFLISAGDISFSPVNGDKKQTPTR